MKFDQVLKKRWSRGFFFNNTLKKFNIFYNGLVSSYMYLNSFYKIYINKRFENTNYTMQHDTILLITKLFIKLFNLKLSFIWPPFLEINHFLLNNILKLYLIKNYKGFCHLLGKPVSGQRSWSNAWNSYLVNRQLRSYLKRFKSF